MKFPGLVDLQVNGFKGIDFSDPGLTEEGFAQASRELLDAGTTAFLPTLITSPLNAYCRNLSFMARVMDFPEFRNRLLGIHLEGPFVSAEPGARGIHNPLWIRRPDVDFLKRLNEWARGKIKLITIAAELPGAEDLTRFAISQNITVSLGHHLARQEDLERLGAAGATALTHLGNGVPLQVHRHENPIWAGLAEDGLSAMIITDGHHLPAPVLKTILRSKGVHRCIVVSDASPLAGLPPGRYTVQGNEVVLEESGLLYVPATGYLAGSSLSMLQSMNALASLNLLTVQELIAVGFHNPLRLIRMEGDSLPAGSPILYDEEEKRFRVQ